MVKTIIIRIIIIIIIIITTTTTAGPIIGLTLIGWKNARTAYSTLLLLADDSLSRGHILITERRVSLYPASVTNAGTRNLPLFCFSEGSCLVQVVLV
jgi:hypothetical protein